MSADPREAQLLALWRDRAQLDESGWEGLWYAVQGVLGHCHCPELSGLPYSREECILDFFHQKVFEPALRGTGGELRHAGALVAYFRNFLRDLLDDPYLVRRVITEEELEPRDPSGREDIDPDDFGELLELTGTELSTIVLAAQRFFDGAPDWVLPYLALNTCADAEDVIPLYRLKDLYAVASHHYKARQLGITRRKGECETDYDQTLLGQWLLSLGVAPVRENVHAMEDALKILCQVALTLQKRGAQPSGINTPGSWDPAPT